MQWNGTKVSLSFVMLAMLLHLFLLPAIPGTGADVRGNNEMFPLNGPTWSLFFEYIGNILYALWLRKLSTKALRVVVILSGAGLASFSLFNLSGFGHLGVGWTLLDKNFLGGMLRLLFAFSIGLLMSRDFKPVKIRGAFLICSLTIIGLLSAPYIGGPDSLWMNGLYDAGVPSRYSRLGLGASGKTSSKAPEQLCRFLGDISYPLYMVHYPLMYLFYAWIWKNGFTFGQTWMVAVGLFVGNIVLAYLLLKVYDEPVRRLLAKRFLHKNG